MLKFDFGDCKNRDANINRSLLCRSFNLLLSNLRRNSFNKSVPHNLGFTLNIGKWHMHLFIFWFNEFRVSCQNLMSVWCFHSHCVAGSFGPLAAPPPGCCSSSFSWRHFTSVLQKALSSPSVGCFEAGVCCFFPVGILSLLDPVGFLPPACSPSSKRWSLIVLINPLLKFRDAPEKHWNSQLWSLS